ncbi:hypothetical protein BDV12DRAFT_199479 [Aspergillus spectabilis]
MASGASLAALVSEPVSKPSDEALQHSGSHVSKSEDNSALTRPNEARLSEDTKSVQQIPAAITGIANGEANHEQPTVGEKREHEAASTTKATAEESTEPESKKYKRSEEQLDAANGTPATAKSEPSQTGSEKKKAGRRKKTKDSIRKEAPTDGIGSRTRSRTKVVS